MVSMMSYKKRKREFYRTMVAKYGLAADVAEQAYQPEIAMQYRKVAMHFQKLAEDVRTSKLTSFQMKRRDQKANFNFNRLYPEAVELF